MNLWSYEINSFFIYCMCIIFFNSYNLIICSNLCEESESVYYTGYVTQNIHNKKNTKKRPESQNSLSKTIFFSEYLTNNYEVKLHSK